MHQVSLLINGETQASSSTQFIDVTNPANNQVIAQVPCATEQEIELAIMSAQRAFDTWKDVPVTERARVMMRYQALLKEHQRSIAETLAQETGKTIDE